MNPIFIEVNGHYINIVTICLYKMDNQNKEFTKVFYIGEYDGCTYNIPINEFKAKIDEALAKKN